MGERVELRSIYLHQIQKGDPPPLPPHLHGVSSLPLMSPFSFPSFSLCYVCATASSCDCHYHDHQKTEANAYYHTLVAHKLKHNPPSLSYYQY